MIAAVVIVVLSSVYCSNANKNHNKIKYTVRYKVYINYGCIC